MFCREDPNNCSESVEKDYELTEDHKLHQQWDAAALSSALTAHGGTFLFFFIIFVEVRYQPAHRVQFHHVGKQREFR